MSNKNYEQGSTISDDFKEQTIKYTLSKKDDDLYHEEDNILFKVIRVKRIGMPNREEKWKIFDENKVIFVVEGHKLAKKERAFLRGIDGVNFLIGEFKRGVKSFNALKIAIKKVMKKSKKIKKT